MIDPRFELTVLDEQLFWWARQPIGKPVLDYTPVDQWICVVAPVWLDPSKARTLGWAL